MQGTFIFLEEPAYGYYLSVGAVFLNTSWVLHNLIAWMKNKPFLSATGSKVYLWTVIASIPYWILEVVANILFFNAPYNQLFIHTRPFEALFRDPWWLFTTGHLFYTIKTRYNIPILKMVSISPRFAVLLGAMLLSVVFIIVDILSVVGAFSTNSLPSGINPFWKLAYVFKCLTDTVILDDFKTALEKVRDHKFSDMKKSSAARGTGRDLETAITRTVQLQITHHEPDRSSEESILERGAHHLTTVNASKDFVVTTVRNK